MSKALHQKQISLITDPEFLTFLQPSPSPILSKPSRVKTKSQDFSDIVHSAPLSTVNASRPKNLNLSFQRKRSTQETAKLKVNLMKTDTRSLFKAHGIYLSKASYQNSERNIIKEELLKKLGELSKKLENLMGQNDSTQLKQFRSLLVEVYEGFSKISSEVESKVLILVEKYERSEKELKEKLEEMQCSQKVQEKQVIDSLVEKSVSLSSKNAQYELLVSAQTVINIKEKIERLEKEIENCSLKLMGKEECNLLSTTNSLEPDLKTHDFQESIINILTHQLGSKDQEINRLRKNCLDLKGKLSKLESTRVEHRRRAKCEISTNSFPIDLTPFLECLALSIEDLI